MSRPLSMARERDVTDGLIAAMRLFCVSERNATRILALFWEAVYRE